MNPKILLVDDDAWALKTFIEILNDGGYEAEAVASGAEALKKLEETSYDLVVTDLSMPGMDGFELVTKIRGAGLAMPIIMRTGMTTRENEERALACGVDFFMDKLCGPKAFIDKIAELIAASQHS